MRDRGLTRAVIERGVASGAEAVVLTVDTPVLGPKRRGLRDVRRPDLLASMRPLLDRRAPDEQLSESDAIEQDPDLTPEIIAFVREVSGLPVVVKGVLRGDDAASSSTPEPPRSTSATTAGGRPSGRSRPPSLPEVVDAVGGVCEVYVDGGIRSGADALTALALGARAVLVAQPVLWALAAAGAPGVQHVLEDLRSDLERSMALVGAADLAGYADLVATAHGGP